MTPLMTPLGRGLLALQSFFFGGCTPIKWPHRGNVNTTVTLWKHLDLDSGFREALQLRRGVDGAVASGDALPSGPAVRGRAGGLIGRAEKTSKLDLTVWYLRQALDACDRYDFSGDIHHSEWSQIKALGSKIAWANGQTFGLRYGSKKDQIREDACRLAYLLKRMYLGRVVSVVKESYAKPRAGAAAPQQGNVNAATSPLPVGEGEGEGPPG